MIDTDVARTDYLLTFLANGQLLALPASDIIEIIRPPVLTRVPHGPPSLLGLANFRGAVIPVVSLGGRENGVASPTSHAARVVVVEKPATVGLMVDEIGSLTGSSDVATVDLDALLARDFSTLDPRNRTERVSDRGANDGLVIAAQADRAELTLMGFMLAGQEYALPLEQVAEIVKFSGNVAAMPLTDSAMIGVTSIRDRLLPLVSARVLLGMPPADLASGQARIIVTLFADALVGLVVDAMTAILRVPASAVDIVPPVLTRGGSEARIAAICRLEGGRRLVSVLSPDRIFDAETTAHIFAQAGEARSAVIVPASGDEQSEQFVIFELDGEHYGIPLVAVEEIVRRPADIAAVPHAPKFVAGVMNLRGAPVPVVDQRQRFGVKGGREGAGRILVATVKGLRAGLWVDYVSAILTVSKAELKPAPRLSSVASNVFDRVAVIERQSHMILIVDPGTLLNQAQHDILSAIEMGAGLAAAS